MIESFTTAATPSVLFSLSRGSMPGFAVWAVAGAAFPEGGRGASAKAEVAKTAATNSETGTMKTRELKKPAFARLMESAPASRAQAARDSTEFLFPFKA